jgi:hypothetical protein
MVVVDVGEGVIFQTFLRVFDTSSAGAISKLPMYLSLKL